MGKSNFHPLPEKNNKRKTKAYYNTNGLSEEEVSKEEVKNLSQENLILRLLKKHPFKPVTKSEIWESLVSNGSLHSRTPESSISRALSNLLNDGKVLKLSKLKEGSFGKPNHLWVLRPRSNDVGTQTALFND